MLLATASEEIRLWNFRRCEGGDSGSCLQLMQHFNPHHEQIAKIVWSSDNSLLGSTGKSGKSIHLTSLSEDVSSVKLESNDPPETCLSFNSSNRFLLTGSLNGKVSIYDIKKASLKRSYVPLSTGTTGQMSTTCVTFTPDNFCSVSGHQGGEIVFINIRSGQIYSPMYLAGPNVTTVAGNGGTVQALRFSRFSRSVLASAHSYGTVALWNTNHRMLSNVMDLHHRGPCMDISFSPVNEMLLVSAGLDRTIRCYDVLQAKQVRCVETDHPLLCVSVGNDGYSLGAGTSNGKILLYDLRSAGKPFDSRSVHSGPVSAMKFENERSADCDTMSSVASLESVRSAAVSSSSRRPLVEATNVDPVPRISEVSSSDCKLIEETSVGENDAESTTNGSFILPASSFNANMGDSNVTGSRLLDSCEIPGVLDVSDSGDGRSSKLHKSVHFDDEPASGSPQTAADKLLGGSFSEHLLDLHSTFQSSPAKSELSDSTRGGASAANVGDVARIAAELRSDVARMKKDFDQQLFEWYGKLVWQLCVTENRIISHVNKLLDDRSAMSEELIRLRKENERLKKAF